MKVQILNYDEGRFIIDSNTTKEELAQNKLFISIAPVLKYRENSDIVGALLNVDYSIDGRNILSLGMVISLLYDGWNTFISSHTDLNDQRKHLIPVWEIALNFVRGVIAAKTKGSALEQYFLPDADMEEFAKNALIECVN